MKKLFLLGSLLFIAGCSHNVGTAFNGKVFNIGYDPEFNKFGIQFYSGFFVNGTTRENSKLKVTYDDKSSASKKESTEGNTGARVEYNLEVGKQVTGYYVQAVEAGADQDKMNKYLESTTTVSRTTEGNKVTLEKSKK